MESGYDLVPLLPRARGRIDKSSLARDRTRVVQETSAYLVVTISEGSRPVKIHEVSTTIDMRVNLGDYEGISNPLTMRATLEPGDDPEKCAAELYQQATQMWAMEVLKKLRFYRSKCVEEQGQGRTRAEFDQSCSGLTAELKKLISPK